MSSTAAREVLFIAGALAAALTFVGAVFAANSLLSPRRPTEGKLQPYECGMPQAGDPHVRYPIRYVSVAVLFVLFDIESVLLFAVAPKVRGSITGGAAVLVFASMLAIGLAYAWRTGALRWRS